MDKIIGFFVAMIMLSALAVAVSNRAKTAQVLTALLSGVANLQRAAVSPVTGK
ncbi:MAG TPA: hypothetical protein VJ553_02020 [Candidatus Paceibacterota bacterium]|nr:hypothetical protein [Candidatus Paceibacterota bacterium]